MGVKLVMEPLLLLLLLEDVGVLLLDDGPESVLFEVALLSARLV